jgi:hypothetical protein
MPKKRPNDKYYRNKADELFMSQFRGQPCEVCGRSDGTVGHHVVPKSRSKALRYEKRNIVVLCQSHHMFSNEMAPHSTNQLAVERFVEWYKEAHPDDHEWLKEHEHDITKISYAEYWEMLKNETE